MREPLTYLVHQKSGEDPGISGVRMRPKEKRKTGEQPVIGWQLDLALNPNHELVRLASAIPWDRLAEDFGTLYCADNGRPGVPIRLMVGLHLLKHLEGISDESVVAKWVENPYWQWFCGEEYFQHELPINPSQMTRWRKRIGEEGVEKLLQAIITAGTVTRTITEQSFEKVIVDTTVQPKAIQHPTEARLYRKVHAAMLRIAHPTGFIATRGSTFVSLGFDMSRGETVRGRCRAARSLAKGARPHGNLGRSAV